jgi:hypothetical protein
MKYAYLIFTLLFSSCTYLITGYVNNCDNPPDKEKIVEIHNKTSIRTIEYKREHYELFSSIKNLDDIFNQPIQILYKRDSLCFIFSNCTPYGITDYTESLFVNINKDYAFKSVYQIDETRDSIIKKLFSIYKTSGDHSIVIFMNTSFRKYAQSFIKDYKKMSKEYSFDNDKFLIVVTDKLYCELYSTMK